MVPFLISVFVSVSADVASGADWAAEPTPGVELLG
jgi:hypothetical protein